VGYGCSFGFSEIPFITGADQLLHPLSFIARIFSAACSVSIALFAWRVFRSHTRWGGLAVGLNAAVIAAGLTVSALEGDWEGYSPLSSKGFWIECLTGENFVPEQQAWADHFIAVLEKVSEEFKDADEVPELTDPGLDDETIKTNMTLEEFKVFMTTVNESLKFAIEARDTDDKLKSSECWREIFGEEFPLHGEMEIEEVVTKSYEVALGSTER